MSIINVGGNYHTLAITHSGVSSREKSALKLPVQSCLKDFFFTNEETNRKDLMFKCDYLSKIKPKNF